MNKWEKIGLFIVFYFPSSIFFNLLLWGMFTFFDKGYSWWAFGISQALAFFPYILRYTK